MMKKLLLTALSALAIGLVPAGAQWGQREIPEPTDGLKDAYKDYFKVGVAVNNRNADPINKALNVIGGTAISNGSYVWSSSRYGANNAWSSGGAYGYWNTYVFYVAYVAVPVALLDVSEANI